jgi:hypothetical protein
VQFINKVTRVPETQAPGIPSERDTERNRKVSWWHGSMGPPWNILVSLRVSLKWNYGNLKESFRNLSYFVYELHA